MPIIVVVAVYGEKDQDLPLTRLHVSAQVEPIGIIMPERPAILIQDAWPGKPIQETLTYSFFHRCNPLGSLKAVCSVKGIACTIRNMNSRVDVGNPGVTVQSFQVKLEGSPSGKDLEALKGALLGITGYVDGKPVSVQSPISILLEKEFVCEPGAVVLSATLPTKSVDIRRSLHADGTLSLLGNPPEGVSWELVPHGSTGSKLHLAVNEIALKRRFSFSVDLQVDGGLGDSLRIPVLVNGGVE